MVRKSNLRPSFFKVLIRDDFFCKLRLPSDFIRKYGVILPGNVQLRTSSGETWGVELERIEDDVCYFSRGWTQFASDLELQIGEFLVFWLAGKSTFEVSLYGVSGCERLPSFCKVRFEVPDNDDQAEAWSEDCTFSLHNPRDVKNKQSNPSLGEEAAETSDSSQKFVISRPLYFERCLKKHHRSRLTLRKKFAEMSGLINQKYAVLEYVPRHHFTSVALNKRPGSKFQFDLSWHGFRKENGVVVGKTYSFEFISRKNVIEVNEIKKPG